MATEVRTHNAYTVGWVCALPKEQTAATAMLDKRHSNLPKPLNDPNTYTLGSIGDHNIVIACLPKGKVGTVSAANVAAHMIHAFPGIRFGLMVGIGGGVPRRVRLGDVVVSVPTDQYPGVVQWDMGKAEQGSSFRRTGALNNPPTLLLTALTRLQTDHEMQGTKIPQYLGELKERYPKMVAQYLKSDDLQDILFKAGYDHVDQQHQDSVEDEETGEESESEAGDDCRYCDKTQIVERKPRDMRIHYGLIASGNQVMKDAQARDQLSVDFGRKVLCIEMEAAGLMDGFPCIVIRGICDYADSHKDKAWQKHAAAVAAAYAKELLGYVIADEVCGVEPANALLGIISQDMATIREHTTRKTQLLNEKEDMEIIDWISTVDFGAQQTDTLRRWHTETNQWFLCSKEYQNWLQKHGRTLYCPGIPGAGKTIMASAIINDICHQFSTDSNVALAYVYFSFSRQAEQTLELVLASLLTQLLRGQSFLPDHIRGISKTHQKRGTHLTRNELFTSLGRVISEYDRVFIVLDALDEFTSENRVEFLSDIRKLQTKMNINILATSRPHDEIADKLKDANKETMATMPIVARSEDMGIMLQSVMRTWIDKEIYDDRFRQHVVSKIIKVAEGMFLLAKLHSNALAALPTKGDILDSLDNIDKGSDPLDAVYELSMERIESQGSGFARLAKKILLWIVHAKRNMSSAEITHALAIQLNTKAINDNYCPSIQIIKSICAGLVTVDEESDTVRLVHYTAQEYFEKASGKWFVDAHDHITQACVTYLSFDAFEGYCETIEGFEERCVKFPFYHYASKEWGHHALAATSHEDIVNFLRKERHVHASIQALSTSESRRRQWSGQSQESLRSINGLHVASRFGLIFATKALLADCDVNARDTYGQTPLSWAASNGHGAVVEVLLGAEKANIELPNHMGQSPLLRAASNGHANVVELLLRTRNVDEDLTDEYGRTPLSWAAGNGHKSVVQLLLSTEKVDIDSRDKDYGQTPLSWAAANGHEAVVSLLLNIEKVDVNVEDTNCGQTPLSWASMNGHTAVVALLLRTEKVEADKSDNLNRTPLSWAASAGCEAVVDLLLSTEKFDLNLPDRHGQTPLMLAVISGHKATVERLLFEERVQTTLLNHDKKNLLSLAAEYGHKDVVEVLFGIDTIDVNLPDNNGRTPLSLAAECGYEAVVVVLLRFDAIDVNLPDNNGRTPLSLAAQQGYEAVVRLLLRFDAIDVNLPDNNGRTPLSLAAQQGYEAVVEALLQFDAIDVNLPDNNGHTSLSWAASNGRDSLTRMLLSTNKVDINMPDQSGRTPLSLAAGYGDKYLTQVLLGMEAIDVNLPDNRGRTPLSWAASSGHDDIITMLLFTGKVDVNLPDQNCRTPLSFAAEYGYEAVIEVLLGTEAIDVDLPDNRGRTPLSWAASSGYYLIISMLLFTGKVDANLKDRSGRPPLLWAIEKGFQPAADMLLEWQNS